MNILVHLPTFCTVNRTRVPIIAEDLSDMAAVRLELSQLHHQVEMLVSQISSVSYCKCYNPKQVKNTVDVQHPLNAQCDAKTIDDTIEAHSYCTTLPVPSCSNFNVATNYTSSDDAGLSVTVSAAPVIDTFDGSSVASDRNLAAIVKQDMDKFKEVNRKSRQTRVNNQKRYVVGDSSADAPFQGVAKKVFVCISRLKSDTSEETLVNYLQSKGIKVVSCFKYTDKYNQFSLMRVCISHSGEKKIFDPKLCQMVLLSDLGLLSHNRQSTVMGICHNLIPHVYSQWLSLMLYHSTVMVSILVHADICGLLLIVLI